MTDVQREKIKSLRSQGYGYTAIADAVGLSKDSVRSFCRKNGLAGVKADSNARVRITSEICPQCGKEVIQKKGVRKMRFCSDSCRQIWWNSHRDSVNQKAVYSFTCAGCGKPFTAYGNSHRKYCSHTCYVSDRFKGGDSHE